MHSEERYVLPTLEMGNARKMLGDYLGLLAGWRPSRRDNGDRARFPVPGCDESGSMPRGLLPHLRAGDSAGGPVKIQRSPDRRYGCIVEPCADNRWEWTATFDAGLLPFGPDAEVIAQGYERVKRRAERAVEAACRSYSHEGTLAWEREQREAPSTSAPHPRRAQATGV